MADVRLSICGRQYDVHCADGQEAQLEMLSGLVDAKARTITGGTEVRQLLFAALMLADEAQEIQAKLGQKKPDTDASVKEIEAITTREAEARAALNAAESREQIALARIKALENTPAPATGPSPAMTRALEQMANRIEALADRITPQG